MYICQMILKTIRKHFYQKEEKKKLDRILRIIDSGIPTGNQFKFKSPRRYTYWVHNMDHQLGLTDSQITTLDELHNTGDLDNDLIAKEICKNIIKEKYDNKFKG